MRNPHPKGRTAAILLVALACSAFAETAWAHVQATATPSQHRVQMHWKFPCSGPPPVIGAYDTITVGDPHNPPADLFVVRQEFDPEDNNNSVLMGGFCFAQGNPDEFVYVQTQGCAEAGGDRIETTSQRPSASVGFVSGSGPVPQDSMVHVHAERIVVPGPAPDMIRLTVSGGGLRTQTFGAGENAQSTFKAIVYPDQAAADADANQLIGTGSSYFGAVTLDGTTGVLSVLDGFSLVDFLLQDDGGGQFSARPVLGLTKVVLVPDANTAVVTGVGDPKVSPSSTTGVPTSETPSGLWLANAAPNPARGPVRIRFATPKTAPVSLAIFDQQGRRIRRLVDGEIPAGDHEATWDGRDAAGRAAPSALYFYRLTVEGRTLTGKVFHLR